MLFMKVLLINKFHRMVGGSETYYFGLGDLLRQKGHEVIWFSMADERNVPCAQEKYFVSNIEYNGEMSKPELVKAGMRTLYNFEARRKMEQLIKDEKPDIAHVNLFQSQLTGAIIDALHKHHVPIIYTMHDLKPVCPTYLTMCHGQICRDCIHGNYMPCIRKRCMKDSMAKSILAAMEAEVYRKRKTYDKIDLIITPSDHHKKRLQESRVTKTEVIRMRNFLPDTIRFVDEVKAGTYFLYFGRISVEKGILTLVKAFAQSKTNSDLYLVGKGTQEEEVKALIRELGIENRVKMLGFKRGEELQDIVRSAKAVFMPSECAENAPYSIMEAMAAGRPVIVSGNGGLPEIVKNGENGYISRPRNAEHLAKIFNKVERMTEDELVEMGKTSQRMAREMFSPEKYVTDLLSIYKKYTA